MSVDEHVYIEQTVLPSPQHALPNPPNISHRYFRLVTMETLQGKAFFLWIIKSFPGSKEKNYSQSAARSHLTGPHLIGRTVYRYIFLFWVLYLRCQSLNYSLTDKKHTTAARVDFAQTMASSLNEASGSAPLLPARFETRIQGATFRGRIPAWRCHT